MENSVFNFKNEPKEFLFVNAWQIGIKDGLFHISFGISTGVNEGEILRSFVMTPHGARKLLSYLEPLLKKKNPPEDFLRCRR